MDAQWLSGKEPASTQETKEVQARFLGPPGEGNGNPLQYPCLGKLMDRGAWWATVHGVTNSQTLLTVSV